MKVPDYKAARRNRIVFIAVGCVFAFVLLGEFAAWQLGFKSMYPWAESAISSAESRKAREAREARLRAKYKTEASTQADHETVAWRLCSQAVEGSAKYDFEWTAGVFGARFPAREKLAGKWIFRGDSMKFQNGFGAWRKIKYLCEYDPAKREAVALVY